MFRRSESPCGLPAHRHCLAFEEGLRNKAAEAQSGGKAVTAQTDRAADSVRYIVKVALAGGATETIKVNGADGKVASAK
jgi:hypothetical protein